MQSNLEPSPEAVAVTRTVRPALRPHDWEQHLVNLEQRAAAGLPLFHDGSAAVPNRPADSQESRDWTAEEDAAVLQFRPLAAIAANLGLTAALVTSRRRYLFTINPQLRAKYDANCLQAILAALENAGPSGLPLKAIRKAAPVFGRGGVIDGLRRLAADGLVAHSDKYQAYVHHRHVEHAA
jgi:hypothetical protein